MTTAPISATQAAQQPARPVSASQPAAPLATVDPLKLLNRYKWLLGAAAVGGGILGGCAHFALSAYYPQWRPVVIFQCLPPVSSMTQPNNVVSETEAARFMATQARIMTTDGVLARVAEDPQLQLNAPRWSTPFIRKDSTTGEERFNSVEAIKELRDDVTARVIPSTNLIELSVTDTAKNDATAVVGLVRQKYLAVLRESGRSLSDDRINSLRQSLTRIDTEIASIGVRREQLIQQKGMDSIDDRISATRLKLQETQGESIKVRQNIQAFRKQQEQMEAELNNPNGPAIGPDILSDVEKDPVIIDIKGQIANYENVQQSLLDRGYGRDHREFKRTESLISGAKANLERARQDRGRNLFEGQLDTVRKSLAQLESQELSLQADIQADSLRLTDLARAQSQLTDMESAVKGLIDTKTRTAASLQDTLSVNQLSSADRVVVMQQERVPTEMSFPKLKVLVPAGVILTVGLIGGLVLLREIVDQRIKSPSDITIIPRTRLLGWVPDASEDPAGAGAIETTFRDRPRGVVSESFRNVRVALAKRTEQMDHRTLVFVSGMPGSGTTSVVANLAFAFAAADRKVLIIDANMRRPAMHRVFALPESPGLADVLAKTRDMASCVQATSTPNIDLLSAGSKDQRVLERLATQAMGQTLADARQIYDVILIDTAPAVVAGDAIAIANRADASVLVVRANVEKRGMVARVKNELADARSEFMGVLVNGVKSSAGGYMRGNIKTAHEYQNT